MFPWTDLDGWWSVKLVTAIVLVLLWFFVRYNWDAIREGFRGQLGWGIMKKVESLSRQSP